MPNPLDYQPDDIKFFERYKVAPPSVNKHGTEDDIRENMKRLKPKKWRLEGNKLIAETEMGPLINYIPTDYILEGEDNEGLPKFRKIV